MSRFSRLTGADIASEAWNLAEALAAQREEEERILLLKEARLISVEEEAAAEREISKLIEENDVRLKEATDAITELRRSSPHVLDEYRLLLGSTSNDHEPFGGIGKPAENPGRTSLPVNDGGISPSSNPVLSFGDFHIYIDASDIQGNGQDVLSEREGGLNYIFREVERRVADEIKAALRGAGIEVFEAEFV